MHFDSSCRSMILIETQRVISLNRILLITIGLWPYQRSKCTQLQSILFVGILSTLIIFQLSTFVTTACTLALFIKVSSSTFVFVVYIIIYNMFWIKNETVKYLLEQFEHIANELKDNNEIAIIEKWNIKMKRHAVVLISLSICCLLAVTIFSMCPYIFNIVLSINESRPHHLPIITEYFVDQEKYFYLIVLHMDIAFCIGTIAALAIGLTIKTYLQHICGMFNIVSYRIEQAMTMDILQNINNKTKNTIYTYIIYAIDIHCKAIKYSEVFLSSFRGPSLFLVVITVICLGLNIFRIVLSVNDTQEFLIHFGIIILLLLSLFLGNYAGQEVTDHNNHIFATAYNVQWYKAPLHIQKLILFLLQRGNKTIILNLYGLFVASLETFASLTSAAMSCFTILRSLQQ